MVQFLRYEKTKGEPPLGAVLPSRRSLGKWAPHPPQGNRSIPSLSTESNLTETLLMLRSKGSCLSLSLPVCPPSWRRVTGRAGDSSSEDLVHSSLFLSLKESWDLVSPFKWLASGVCTLLWGLRECLADTLPHLWICLSALRSLSRRFQASRWVGHLSM